LIFDALDHKHYGAGRVVIWECLGDDLLRRGAGAVLAVCLWRRFVVERLASLGKFAIVEVLYQANNIAAFSAAAAVPFLFCDIDRETIFAAAFRARADEFLTLPLQPNPAALYFAFEPRAAGSRNSIVEGNLTGAAHAPSP
jgi:hypothetical protein